MTTPTPTPTATHTPGPWTYDLDPEAPYDDDEETYWSVWTDTDGINAEIAGRIGEEANARLIAAAPELLEALERYVTLHDDESSTITAIRGAHTRFLVEARSAIAKARGTTA